MPIFHLNFWSGRLPRKLTTAETTLGQGNYESDQKQLWNGLTKKPKV